MPVKRVLDEKVPVKIWADEVEHQALSQLRNIARLPFVFKHIAVMPDVHLGIGATVGSVVATKGAVCPAAVGVDIGCGMRAVELPDVTSSALDGKLARLRGSIERAIPVGFDSNRRIDDDARLWPGWEAFRDVHPKGQHRRDKAMAQLGSLGGGNHFIEVCLDARDTVWVMLHSGSRNIGNFLAGIYINGAKGVMRKLAVSLPDPDLAYFAQGTAEYASYMHDLLWCQDYARKNREIMMSRLLRELGHVLGLEPRLGVSVDCHHNFAVMERHFGEEVLVTRKGAVRARRGDLGIIPGSMGTKSYIVRGLGNPESFESCSHGAGRRMSRNAARRRFSVHDLKEQTRGVECRKDSGVIDEIPGAYKDIDAVMEDQSDLVAVVATLKQVLCVKG